MRLVVVKRGFTCLYNLSGLSDCKWEQWGKWSSCSCNNGMLEQTRTRKKLQDSFGQGKECYGSDKDTKACRKGVLRSLSLCEFSSNSGDNCLTDGGGKAGAKCVFPFTLDGITYQGCTRTNDPDDRLWCSTKTDSKGVHVSGQGEWGHCNSDCPTDQGKPQVKLCLTNTSRSKKALVQSEQSGPFLEPHSSNWLSLAP